MDVNICIRSSIWVGILIFHCLGNFLNAQSYTISGYLTDLSSGEVLIGGQVVEEGSKQGALSNDYGFYSLTLPSGEITLRVGYAGYQSQQFSFFLKSDTSLDIALDIIELDAVEIVAEVSGRSVDRTQMSVVEIPIQQLKRLPAILGEVDVVKALQFMPGVSGGNEGTSGLYVRGGGPDQNLILLDGVPLYHVNHLGGFFSMFNADAISQVKLYKGGFPARYGGRLSSVLDIRLKEGNRNDFQGEGNVGLVSSQLTLQGPIVRGKSSFIVSGRRTYADLLLRPFTNWISGGDLAAGYHFLDLSGKVSHRFSDQDQLSFTFFTGHDRFSGQGGEETEEIVSNYRMKLGWGTDLALLRWTHLYGPRLFGNISVSYTQYQLRNEFEGEIEELLPDTTLISRSALRYNSRVQDWAFQSSFDWYPATGHEVRFGLNSTLHTFEPSTFGVLNQSTTASIDTTLGQGIDQSLETALYIEDQFSVGSRFSANLGLHGVHYWIDGRSRFSLQPRLSTRYLLHEDLAIKASLVQMTQFLHLLTNSGVGLPLDLWVPATAQVPPQQAWQAAAGISASLWQDRFDFTLEGYYKRMQGLIAYQEGTSFFLGGQTKGWEELIESNGQGEAYGIEFLLQKKQGRTTGWIGYTLSWNWRQFQQINQGLRFPYRYDRRHDVSLVVTHRLNDRITLSGSWVFNTGQAITLPSGQHPTALDPLLSWVHIPASTNDALAVGAGYGTLPFFDGFEPNNYPTYLPYKPVEQDAARRFGWGVQVYEQGRNGFRMQSYHRLDASINLEKKKNWGKRIWTFGLYNAYSRLNPYVYYVERTQFFDETLQQPLWETRLMKLVLFPIVPSVSYRFEF